MKYKDYNEYLLSDKWQQVKDNFKNSIKYENVCYLCFERTGLQLHHWRYEKDWNHDTHNNVIQLCECCHKSAHQSEVLHNSSMYGPKDLYKYLSHLIKDLKLMEYKHIEFYAVDFIPEEKPVVVEIKKTNYTDITWSYKGEHYHGGEMVTILKREGWSESAMRTLWNDNGSDYDN